MNRRDPTPAAGPVRDVRGEAERVAIRVHTQLVLDALDACAKGRPEEAERIIACADDPESSYPPSA